MTMNAVMPSAFTRLTAQVPDDTFRDFLAEHFQPEKVAPFVAALVHESNTINGECFSVGAGRAARVFLGQTAAGPVPDRGSRVARGSRSPRRAPGRGAARSGRRRQAAPRGRLARVARRAVRRC